MMAHKVACWHLMVLLFYFLVTACHLFAASHGATDAEILVNFKNSLSTNSLLYDWNVSGIPPCTGGSDNWVGLRCNDDGTIDKLLLENMGLNGTIDMDILMQLPKLRTLSFMNNSFEGPMPEVKKLASLRNLYLSNNSFSGKIDKDAFDGMNSLKEVYLAHNEFTGEIPRSLVLVPKLTKLSLEGNQFGGNLPDFPQENLGVFNAAGNNFKGQIPTSLADFSPGSFAGNQGLCGKPLPACKSSRKKTIVIIAVVVVAVVALSATVVLACIRFGGGKKEAQSSDPFGDGKMGDRGQLHFVRHDRDRFDLQDLLRASAEVLGSGIFGSSYKAVLLDGPAMVVKRFRHMSSVGKEEFHEHMRRLGALSHPNLLPLVAYYYRKEDKLLVSDFIENGSLASHLHGKRSSGKPWIDWPTRLRIVKGVAKGLAYLYKEFPTLALPHGHLKSSNVLLDDTFDPLLTDYALVPVVNKDHSQRFMVAYKSPECSRSDRPNRKTDVWSLGILILEILTGKFPENYLTLGKGGDADLATWVSSVVREEWTGEVFDMDMMRTKNCEGEMLKLLKIGMCCCEWNLERRWDLKEAVAKIEELKERDNDDWSNSYASEGEVSSSRAVTDDDFPFSVNS
uniref:non-specific serine/threonine protein kinase n=1 Tax=Salix viminalis TaxID=40686 RepID=A0A6N2KC32_SALVM